MSFFFAFSAAGLLLAGFGLLAFRYARTLCLHLLVVFVYFVALPLASAWLYTGQITSRALIGQDLYSYALADALFAHTHLYVLFGVGVLAVGAFVRDGKIAAAVEATLRAQRYNPLWLIAFVAALAAEFLIKVRYEMLISGSTLTEGAEPPYLVTSTLFVLASLVFGLFSMLAVLSARTKL